MTEELAINQEQYDTIMHIIKKNHAFGGHKPDLWLENRQLDCCKHIKYVRPSWDLRDNMCFTITFNGMGLGKSGITFSSGYGETVPMHDRIIAWLHTPNVELRPKAIESTE